MDRIQEFYDFIQTREGIRLKRLDGIAPPWTDDPILKEYSFTNVKRIHDRTTQEFIKLLYEEHQQVEPKLVLLNAAIARYFGLPAFVRAMGGWQTGFDGHKLVSTADKMFSNGEHVFTGAYLITNGGYSGPKQKIVTSFIQSLWEHSDEIIDIAISTGCWKPTIEYMKANVFGMGGSGFMCKEIILDCRLTSAIWKNGRPADANLWTPIGPGTARGAARMLGDTRRVGRRRRQIKATPASTLSACQAIFAERSKYWPANYVELELTDIAFQLCEFDKYERARLGEGRPRKRYRFNG